MTLLLVLLYLLTAVAGAGVVLTRDPRRQALALAANGIVLVFMALQAPDVAFSQLVIGTAAVPLMFLVTLAAIRVNRKPNKPDAAASGEDEHD